MHSAIHHHAPPTTAAPTMAPTTAPPTLAPPTPAPTTAAPVVTAPPIPIEKQPKIKLVTYPTDVLKEDTMIFKWEVTGGVQGNITHTAIHYGTKSGKVFTDYSMASKILTGKSPGTFTVTVKAPEAGGVLYFRAHAIVDGQHVYTEEKTIVVG
ncbi:MAG: hypothetical protein AABX40_02475 [Candidatus Hydrothermarchaeota archaeon]